MRRSFTPRVFLVSLILGAGLVAAAVRVAEPVRRSLEAPSSASFASPSSGADPAPHTSPEPRTLGFEERVEAQRAIERVFWSHRIWPADNPEPKPSLEAVLPEEALREQVSNYLAQSSALDRVWGRPISGAELEAELRRMVETTQDPGVLEELFAALDDDPFVIAETLARQQLADRLVRQLYARDESLHQDVRARAEAARATGSLDALRTSGEWHEIRWVRGGLAQPLDPGDPIHLPEAEWDGMVSRLIAQHLPARAEGSSAASPTEAALEYSSLPLGVPSGLVEEDDRFLITIVLSRQEGELTEAVVSWPKDSFDSWWAGERVTLSEALLEPVWPYEPLPAPRGGSCGGAAESWTATTTTGAPEARNLSAGVWTGTEMIVFGGRTTVPATDTGGRYVPATNSWTATPTSGAPAARVQHTAIWTGTQVIFWGGFDFIQQMNTGGRYDPTTDAWTATATSGAPQPRNVHTAVWTGTHMVVWGGNPTTATGSRYNPTTNSWAGTTLTGVPVARYFHTAVWTGSQMIVWGGISASTLNDGARYDPTSDTWIAMSTSGRPAARYLHSAVWTGAEMILWGGNLDTVTVTNSGGLYDPTDDVWAPSALFGAPSVREQHSAVWTGAEMIIWGGDDTAAFINTGKRYAPFNNTWQTMTQVGAPGPRSYHVTAWTGTQMIVWSGFDGSVRLNTGGRYAPPGSGGTSGGPCDDGDECTTDDTCMSGVCIGGPPPDCNDSDPCTIDSCDTAIGCVNFFPGPDNDGDEICDEFDPDDDNDTVPDAADSAPLDRFVCRDQDSDTCDDCTSGTANPANDGTDTDADGQCNASDPDDDNDTVPDADDSAPLDRFQCRDVDGDTCDDCAGGPSDVLLATFDAGADTFTYADDRFRGTAQPTYAQGTFLAGGGFAGGGLTVTLGGVNNTLINGMSGGWQRSFTLAWAAPVTLTLRYNLTHPATFESDESSQALVAIDGVLHGTLPQDYVAQLTGNGTNQTTGWQVFTRDLGTLAAGSHTVAVGGYLNKKTTTDEVADVRFDDVRLTATFGGTPSPSTDGPDFDADGLCNAGDPDDDNDAVADASDSAPLNSLLCRDVDADTCDDCSSGTDAPANDGTDTDTDGLCNSGDPDDDNDTVADAGDSAPLNRFLCRDQDSDTCDDCTSGTANPASDGTDTDADGGCNASDACTDADHDGVGNGNLGNTACVVTVTDSNDANAQVCADTDSDACNDCSSGTYAPAADGTDTDTDGLCNTGDPDDDNDTVADGADSAPLNRFLCRDQDSDTCDDCTSGTANPASDGTDTDSDGLCNTGDPDDDNDTVADGADSAPLNRFLCRDQDTDTCDDCTSGTASPANDGTDTDVDGLCNAGDPDDDNDTVPDGADSAPLDRFLCRDVDGDTCDDCAATPSDVVLASFDAGADTFVYADDRFRGTSQPTYAQGTFLAGGGFAGGGITVSLGGVNNNTINGMSGGWQRSFTLASAAPVTLTLRYNLTHPATFESDESSQALVAIDGVLRGTLPQDYIAQLTGNGSNQTTGWQVFTRDLGTLAAGSHTVAVGGYLSKKNNTDELADVRFDDVRLTATFGGIANPASDGPDFEGDGLCNAGDPDDDNDTVADGSDSAPLDRFLCRDQDADTCDDCTSGTANPASDGTDTDTDGLCNTGDTDDDGDTVADGADSAPLNRFLCRDQDADACDDCTSGTANPANDGTDTDTDGLCNTGDTDDDGDTVADGADSAPLNRFLCRDQDADTCDDCTSGTANPASDGTDTDTDGLCNAGDACTDADHDGVGNGNLGNTACVVTATDSNDANASVCLDTDSDGCNDCSSGTYAPAADGTDTDTDGLCNTGDPDDDNDTVADAGDSAPLNRFLCRDQDADTCDDCTSGTANPASDGTDTDTDGLCNTGDTDDDGDTVADGADSAPLNRFLCRDQDADTCDDCTSGTANPASDGTDTDADGQCNASDACTDADHDGVGNGNLGNTACVVTATDSNDANASVCLDTDSDGCNDCSSGTYAPAADGTDTDTDGLCNTGDPDDDNDTVADAGDSAPLNRFLCRDQDADTCDDCTSGTANPASDGTDTDTDGLCNTGDTDDDGDTVADGADSAPLNRFLCRDQDADTCDDCTSGTANPASDGTDTDADGQCNASDACTDADHDGVGNGNLGNTACVVTTTDSNDANAAVCLDTDSDGCNDCSSGTYAPAADGTDTDTDGLCNTGDPDDDNDTVADGGDSAPLNRFLCRDQDSDTCDDCTSGTANTASDGTDTDTDGLCNAGDPDDDNDTVADGADSAPLNRFVCRDLDTDTCDDCTSGAPNPANDGTDTDTDGRCDAGDACTDVDGDGVGNGNLGNTACAVTATDSNDSNPSICVDSDSDGCNDCSSGSFAPAADGTDTDIDGLCNTGDSDDDNDTVNDTLDCAPLSRGVSAVPASIGDNLRVDRVGASGGQLSWAKSSQGLVSNVYRGTIVPGQAWEYNESCLMSELVGTTTLDPAVPPSGTVFYYLVGAKNLCGDSAIGLDGQGVPRIAAPTCPATGGDTDSDGVLDVQDHCPLHADPTLADGDGDFHGNVCDNCSATANPDQRNLDGDATGDACDLCTDDDGDGFADPGYPASTCPVDNCPATANPAQADGDGDHLGDICDVCPADPANDPDADAVCNSLDNCPAVANPQQQNADNDATGDACDTCIDTDSDGFGNPGFPSNTCATDNCPSQPNDQLDSDSDTLGDVCDACPVGGEDPDHDTVCLPDNCPSAPNPGQEDADGDARGDACDPCRNNPSLTCVTCPDAASTDPDEDGVCDTDIVLQYGAADTAAVQFGSTTRYLANSSDPGTGMSWTAESYDDMTWSTGTFGLGYETAPPGAQNLIPTTVPPGSASIFTRTTFTVDDASELLAISVAADYDDGYVVWINGVEVFRSPEVPAEPLDWETVPGLHESSNGATPNYGPPNDVSAAALPAIHDGTNVLAIAAYNQIPSSDFVIVPRLTLHKAPSMHYRVNSSDPGIGLAWTATLYDESGWLPGDYGVGYETGGGGAQNLLITTVPSGTFSVYTRAHFDIPDASVLTQMLLGADYDDGYVAWLNGVEVFRTSNMPGPPDWDENASPDHESSNGTTPNYGTPIDLSASLSLLVDGDNVLAIGVWNNGAPSSSDLVLVPRLSVRGAGDNCASVPNPSQANADGDAIGDACDTCTDTDGDGFGNTGFPANTCPADNCASVANPTQANADGDAIGDACDTCTDTDGDGFGNTGFPANTCPADNCASVANPTQANADGDAIGDACDTCTDTDGDGFGNTGFPANTCPADNCASVANPTQANADGDAIGDACDTCTDTDGDGFGNTGFPANTCPADNCASVANPTQANADGDAIGDACDTCTDTDGDGFGNTGFPANTCPADNCASVANPTQANADGDATGDACDTCTDTDGDLFGDPGFPVNTCGTDNCPTVANPLQTDGDGDGIGDFCEPAVVTGTYTGNGTDNRNIAVGYQPDVVIIKGNNAAAAVLRTSTMSGDASKSLTGGTLSTNAIQAFNAAGFQVGTATTVNASGVTYQWVAFRQVGGELRVGSYTGNGTDNRSITGVGFQPEYAIVVGAGNNEPMQRMTSMSGDASVPFEATGLLTNGIQALEADGFQLGTSTDVNGNGTVYHYAAWNAVAGKTSTASYTGNGTDNRSISGAGFQPQYVIVKAAAANAGAHRTASLSGDSTLNFTATANFADGIQALQASGFQVGTNLTVNANAVVYHWVAFTAVPP